MGNVIIDSFKLKSLLTQTLEIDDVKLAYILKVLNKELEEGRFLDVYLVRDIFEKTQKSLHSQLLIFLFDILKNDRYSFEEISKLIRGTVLPKLYLQKGIEFLTDQLSEDKKIYVLRVGSMDNFMKPKLTSKTIQEILEQFDYYFKLDGKLFNELKNALKEHKDITFRSILGYSLYKNFDLINELTPTEFQNIFQSWSDEFYFKLESSDYLSKLEKFSLNNQIPVLEKFRMASLIKDNDLIEKYTMAYLKEKGIEPELPRKLTINEIVMERAYEDFLDLKKLGKNYLESEIYIKLNNIFSQGTSIPSEDVKEIYYLYEKKIKRNMEKINRGSYENLLKNILTQKEGFELYTDILKTKSEHLISITEYLSKILKEIRDKKRLEIEGSELLREVGNVIKLFEDHEIFEDYKGLTSVDYFIELFFEININNPDFFNEIKNLRKIFPKNISYYLGQKIMVLYKSEISVENKEYILNSLNREMLIGVSHSSGITLEILLDLFRDDLIIEHYNRDEFKGFVSSRILEWLLWLYSVQKIERKSLQKIKKSKYIYSKAFEYVVYNEDLELNIRKILYEDILMDTSKQEEYKSKILDYSIFLEILEKEFLDSKEIEKILKMLFENSKNRRLTLEIGKQIIEKLNKINESYSIVFIISVVRNIENLYSGDFIQYIINNKELASIEYEVLDEDIDRIVKGYLKENKLDLEKIENIKLFL